MQLGRRVFDALGLADDEESMDQRYLMWRELLAAFRDSGAYTCRSRATMAPMGLSEPPNAEAPAQRGTTR